MTDSIIYDSMKSLKFILAGILLFRAMPDAIASPSALHDYRAVDEHALNAPVSVTKSFKTLARWLTEPFQSDEEKTRALFRWITQNISYDVDAYFSGRYMSGRAEDALKNKRGVCEGYSGLFEQLARAAGITVVKISGFAKGYGYAAGGAVGSVPNHAWNAVKVNGDWKLLDCTWGAGYIGDDRKFHREFNPHYFFTPPAEFVFDHLPEEQKWQLLDRPRSKDEYQKMVYLRPKFFALGLELSGEPDGTLRTTGELNIKLRSPRDVLAMALLQQGGRKLDERWTFVQQEGDVLSIHALPPVKGDHILRLFAKAPSEKGDYEWVLDYHIEATGDLESPSGYPRMFAAFQEKRAILLEPLQGKLQTGVQQRFRLRIPGAEQAAVIAHEKWSPLHRRGDLFEGEATIAAGDIGVYAKYPGSRDFDALLEYRGE